MRDSQGARPAGVRPPGQPAPTGGPGADRPRAAPVALARRASLGERVGSLSVAVLVLVVKRALGNPSLVAFTLLGLVVCVALLAAVPLYADGMMETLLRIQLARSPVQPALALRIRHQEDPSRPTTAEQLRRLDRYVAESAAATVGLPHRTVVRFASLSSHQLFASDLDASARVYDPGQARYAEIAALSDLARHVRIVEGEPLPAEPAASAPGGPDDEIPVLVTRTGAEELRLAVGERYWYVGRDASRPERLAVRIVGVWEPADRAEIDYWTSHLPDVTYTYTLFASETDFHERVLPAFAQTRPLNELAWYVVYEPAAMHSTRIERVRAGLRSLELDLARLMPDTKVDGGPAETLEYVSRQAGVVKALLLILSTPLLAVALYYVYVSLSMVMEHQRGEISFLRSRGASPAQIVLIYLVESLVVGAVALGLGLVVGVGIAQVIGLTVGFLQFAARPPLPTYPGRQALEYGLLAVGLAVVCAVLPAARAARHSIVAHERQAARRDLRLQLSSFALEAVLVVAAAYGYFSLRQGAPVVRIAEVDQVAGQLVGQAVGPLGGQFIVDPLLLLLPALFVCALALVYRRLVPPLVALLALWAARPAGAPTLLALRQVCRAPGGYGALVFLVVVTLGLGVYAASAARTLESNYVDRARYAAPASLEIAEKWDYDPDTNALLEPPLDAVQVPGVKAYSRTQAYTARLAVGRATEEVQVLGIDRESFALVSWWRADFARVPLGALLNALSVDDNAAIASTSFLVKQQLRLGDVVQLSFQPQGVLERRLVDFRLVESASYFPTLYPERGEFFVASLDYLHDQVGLGMYNVWLDVDPAVRTPAVIRAIEANGVPVIRIQDQRLLVNLGRLEPQRTGILGLLSLAYVVAAALTVFGFFLHTLLTFQQRTPQLGVLRTIGLSASGLVRSLLIEQSSVVALGVAAGVGIGTLASRLFIPLLQSDVDRTGTTPPFLVEAAWGDVQWILLVLALMLAAGTLTTLGLIRHMRLNQAIRLGERV